MIGQNNRLCVLAPSALLQSYRDRELNLVLRYSAIYVLVGNRATLRTDRWVNNQADLQSC